MEEANRNSVREEAKIEEKKIAGEEKAKARERERGRVKGLKGEVDKSESAEVE